MKIATVFNYNHPLFLFMLMMDCISLLTTTRSHTSLSFSRITLWVQCTIGYLPGQKICGLPVTEMWLQVHQNRSGMVVCFEHLVGVSNCNRIGT